MKAEFTLVQYVFLCTVEFLFGALAGFMLGGGF